MQLSTGLLAVRLQGLLGSVGWSWKTPHFVHRRRTATVGHSRTCRIVLLETRGRNTIFVTPLILCFSRPRLLTGILRRVWSFYPNALHDLSSRYRPVMHAWRRGRPLYGFVNRQMARSARARLSQHAYKCLLTSLLYLYLQPVGNSRRRNGFCSVHHSGKISLEQAQENIQ